MTGPRHGHRDATDARDPSIGRALESLDPERTERGYWLRFHRGVMAAAARELARRRMIAEVTVVDVVTTWGRALVPTALLAAAIAALLLLRPSPTPMVTPLGVEELLAEGLEGAPIPAVLASEAQLDAGGAHFAHETY